mmetsp:Transcript_2634/g.5440  ORF Transcript_2634/g.5440 Transcript_2634/m.5440 type:complete len:205 (+) Transcript_2634:1226-1840(+)
MFVVCLPPFFVAWVLKQKKKGRKKKEPRKRRCTPARCSNDPSWKGKTDKIIQDQSDRIILPQSRVMQSRYVASLSSVSPSSFLLFPSNFVASSKRETTAEMPYLGTFPLSHSACLSKKQRLSRYGFTAAAAAAWGDSCPRRSPPGCRLRTPRRPSGVPSSLPVSGEQPRWPPRPAGTPSLQGDVPENRASPRSCLEALLSDVGP